MTNDRVKISPPNKTLHHKIGFIKLDSVFTPDLIAEAEKSIKEVGDAFMEESIALLKTMQQANEELQKNPTGKDRYLPIIVESSFSMKSKIGANGYTLIASLAKSMQLFCERMQKAQLNSQGLDIIKWHIASIAVLLKNNLKGDGGEIGKEILAQLKKLAPPGVL